MTHNAKKEAARQAKRASAVPNVNDGFNWVPAANLFSAFGGLGIYVKYKGGKKNKILIKHHTAKSCHLICPDRELLFTWENQYADAYYPAGMGFHEYVSLNTLDDTVCKKMGIKYAMTNFVHVDDTAGAANNRTQGRPPNSDVTMLSDSGGFQFSTGVVGAVNPLEMIKFYNKNVDAGMCLDVPLTVPSRQLVQRAGALQAKNLELLVKHKANHVDLLNILHGATNEEAEEYREIVERPDVDRLAMAGLYRRGIVSGADYIWNTTRNGQRYKQYHMLGIFSNSHLAMMVAAANLGDNPPHITSDSTSHIQSAKNRTYHYHLDVYKTHGRALFGAKGSIPNVHNTLPCHCPVCETVKYSDVLGFLPGQMMMSLTSVHNAYTFIKYTQMLQDACRQLPWAEYVELVTAQLSHLKSRDSKEVLMSLDFLYRAAHDGLASARKHYPTQIKQYNSRFSDGKEKVGLFGSGQEPTETRSRKQEIARINAILDTMEQQHEDIVAGRTVAKSKAGSTDNRLDARNASL